VWAFGVWRLAFGVSATEWRNRIAQGFSPGLAVQEEIALKGRPNYSGLARVVVTERNFAVKIPGPMAKSASRSDALSGRSFWDANPGLKPWAFF
jgi:hypothetical protein